MANLNSDISEGDNDDDYDLKLNLTTSQKVHLQQFKKKNVIEKQMVPIKVKSSPIYNKSVPHC